MRIAAIAFCLGLAAFPAKAEIAAADATSFTVHFEADLVAPAAKVWGDIVQPAKWWSKDHTWSKDAANLNLTPKAGDCFCEIWGKNSVEHARVISAMPPRALRLNGALGPLQALGVTGVLTFELADKDGKTHLALTYLVTGPESAGLEQVAPAVDQVLGEQFARLTHLVETGGTK